MTRDAVRMMAALATGAVLGAVVAMSLTGEGQRAAAQLEAGGPSEAEALRADLETVKGKLASQSHAMEDVGRHFTNLWFAAEKQNWPLAKFYNDETLSHLHWAVRIIPVRKDLAGVDVKLEEMLQAWEYGAWKRMQAAIDAKDGDEFGRAYRSTIEACYACHKAADKPYLRPQIPTEPAGTIINFEPTVSWPP